MRVVKPWVTALNIDEGTFAGWTAKAPKHESVTFWCLDRGHIRASDYFAWAMNHYGLPLVQGEYFTAPANRELWLKIQSVANWGPDLLPLEEWDGIIYVACVEPPQDIRWSFPVQYILAAPKDLKHHWDRLNTEPTQVSASFKARPPVVQDEEEEHTSPGLTAPIELSEPANVPAPKITAQAPPAVEAPEGFKLNLPPSMLETPPPPTPQAAGESPDGLNLNFIGKNALQLEKLAPEGMPDLPAEVLLAKAAPAPTAPPVKQPVEEKITGSFTLVNGPTPTTASGKTGSIDADRVAPNTLEAARTENEAIAWVFQQLKQHFRHSWLFIMQAETLKIWKWECAAQPTSPDAEAPIDLSKPSLFRIVSRTAMPYHGHVVESPTNTGFFRAWGLRNTPPHVTAVPLMSNGHVVAILLCSGDKPAQPDQVLRFTEKMGHAVASQIGRKAAA